MYAKAQKFTHSTFSLPLNTRMAGAITAIAAILAAILRMLRLVLILVDSFITIIFSCISVSVTGTSPLPGSC